MRRWEDKYHSLQNAYKSIWKDYMGVQMLALDVTSPRLTNWLPAPHPVSCNTQTAEHGPPNDVETPSVQLP